VLEPFGIQGQRPALDNALSNIPSCILSKEDDPSKEEKREELGLLPASDIRRSCRYCRPRLCGGIFHESQKPSFVADIPSLVRKERSPTHERQLVKRATTLGAVQYSPCYSHLHRPPEQTDSCSPKLYVAGIRMIKSVLLQLLLGPRPFLIAINCYDTLGRPPSPCCPWTFPFPGKKAG